MCVCYYRCMYVCMYVCMHACMYVCTYACMYVCMYVRMHVCMYVCACMYVCTCMYVCACMYVSFIPPSVLRPVHSPSHSQFSTQCDLVLPLSVYNYPLLSLRISRSRLRLLPRLNFLRPFKWKVRIQTTHRKLHVLSSLHGYGPKLRTNLSSLPIM